MNAAPALAAISGTDVAGLAAAAAVCVFLLYALLRGENL
jgi:hypothetical protein